MADTPLMVQYKEMKKQYPDMVLFFRLGDFYEMFDEDAVEVSSLLNLTLTHKGDSPMCGIPYHAVKNYLKRLLDAGKKIAICEQLELSDTSKALAKREVVRIITPATVVDEDLVDDRNFSYIACFFRCQCAFCDVTTGDFHLRNLDSKNRIQEIRSVISQITPKEILVCEDEYFLDSSFREAIDYSGAMVTKLAPWYFTLKTCFSLLCEQAGVKNLSSFGLEDNDRLLGPAGALLRYVRETSKDSVSHLCNYKLDTDDIYVSMDESSRKNLELFSNLSDRSSRYSLFDTINKCRTCGGTRLLKSWMAFPLRSIEQIKFRQDWITDFKDNPSERDRVFDCLSGAGDMNRLTTRILLKRAVPHDLTAVKHTLSSFFSLVSENPEKYSSLFEKNLDNENLSRAASLMQEIDLAVNDEFLGQFNPGEVIKPGYDEELDRRRSIHENGNKVLSDYLEQEKAKSGITVLKLGYNRVFGYYLEVSKGQVDRVPDYFLRKQTLVNGERFTTQTLQKYEQEILSAASLAEERERKLYENLLSKTLELNAVLNAIGHFLSNIDVFRALATLAVEANWCRPTVTSENVLVVKGGRHPVVEKQLGAGKFVANNLDMSTRFCLITGPNMAGKSTFLRQNAIIILLAHMGSYVPADEAVIGLTDRIFCRVGASDNLARGESTFLVEMQETAFILRNCTEHSFVIVDEIGRGTSTQDGMSIAFAVMNELIKKNVKTLFATHYHELTMMDMSGIRLLTLEVLEENGDVRFIRRVIDGVANSSYGIHVAKLAGIPSSVIREAKSFQSRHFADYSMNQSSLFTCGDSSDAVQNEPDYYSQKVREKLSNINIDEMTPMQAMIVLSQLKEIDEN